MKTIQSVLIAALLGLIWTSCQQNAPDTSSFGNFSIVPEQSSITWNLTPTFSGVVATLHTPIAQGGLEVQKRQVLEGKATIEMMMPIFEAAIDTTTREQLFKSVRGKSMFHTARHTFGVLQIETLTPQPKGNDVTHLAKVTLKMRNKKHRFEIPVRVLVRRGNAVITTPQPFKVSLSEWGMKPEKEKWMDSAEISLRIRATGAVQPGEPEEIAPKKGKGKGKGKNKNKNKNNQPSPQ